MNEALDEALARVGLDTSTALVMLALLVTFFITAKVSLKMNDVDQHH